MTYHFTLSRATNPLELDPIPLEELGQAPYEVWTPSSDSRAWNVYVNRNAVLRDPTDDKYYIDAMDGLWEVTDPDDLAVLRWWKALPFGFPIPDFPPRYG